MRVFTIGFTKTTAERFFGRLRNAGVQKIADVRLNNVSQLSGFAKKDDLRFFAKEICGIEYEHLPELAPTQDILKAYRNDGDWVKYEKAFWQLMKQRSIESISDERIDGACLLCSENKPHYCHRRLVVEYLKEHKENLQITHL